MAWRSPSRTRRDRRCSGVRRSARRREPSGLAVDSAIIRRFSRPLLATAWCGGRRRRRAAQNLRPAGSAADAVRPRHSRRAGRRRVAAGAADRSLAEPADAARTRPRSAGAAHRAVGARFRAIARRRRCHPQPRRQGRRRAGGGVAFPAPARGGGGRGALEGREAGRRKICSLRRSDRPARRGRADPAAGAKAAARRPAAETVGDGDRGLAARSLYDLCQAHSGLAPLDPVDMPLSAADRGSAIHDALGEFTQTFADDAARRSGRRAARHRREIFRAADGAAGSAGAVVAAFSAHRALVCRIGRPGGARDVSRIDAEIRGEISIPLDHGRTFTLVGARRPHRAPPRRHVRHPRLQDRAAADRQTGAHGTVAAAHAGSGDPARRRLCRISRRHLGQRTRLCQAQRQQSAGRAKAAGAEDQTRRHAATAR